MRSAPSICLHSCLVDSNLLAWMVEKFDGFIALLHLLSAHNLFASYRLNTIVRILTEHGHIVTIHSSVYDWIFNIKITQVLMTRVDDL